MIQRTIAKTILQDLSDGRKVVILYGPRQAGKTTLARQVLQQLPYKSLEINADQQKFIEVLSSRDLAQMQRLVGDSELLFIDEAQHVPNIGINLKILHDGMPNLRIIATGSSSFELANQVKEPLTGRTRTHTLYPISVQELRPSHTDFALDDRLEDFLLFGMYPEILQLDTPEQKTRHLRELASAYLYKDILQLSSIKNSDKIFRLLRLLAFQVGSQVSTHELGKSLDMSHETISKYIDLLEKGFIVFRLSGYSRNLRKEVSKMNKVYFYDTGIRNVLVENFNPLQWRQDAGQLWENFLLVERLKKLAYQPAFHANQYFWRTYTGAELDYVEETGGRLHGFEFKWGKKQAKPPATWLETYQEADFQYINRENYLDFIAA
ncbi:MAG: ATP-binding protein [Saprospiraceae bacterium]